MQRLFTVLGIIMDRVALILAGRKDEAEKLKDLYILEEYKGWESNKIIKSAKLMMSKTNKSSSSRSALKDLFAKSMET